MIYSLNTNWLFSKQFKAATATLLLAASMLMMMGLPIAPSAQAAATGTLTLSSSQIFGNQTVSMTITDSDIGVQEMKDTYNPSVVLQWTNATNTYTLNVTQNTGGSWVAYATDALYVVYGCSTQLNVTSSDKSHNASHTAYHPGHAPAGQGSNGLAVGSCAKSYINTGHLANGVPSTRTYANHTYRGGSQSKLSATHSIASSPMIHGMNMTRGERCFNDIALQRIKSHII